LVFFNSLGIEQRVEGLPSFCFNYNIERLLRNLFLGDRQLHLEHCVKLLVLNTFYNLKDFLFVEDGDTFAILHTKHNLLMRFLQSFLHILVLLINLACHLINLRGNVEFSQHISDKGYLWNLHFLRLSLAFHAITICVAFLEHFTTSFQMFLELCFVKGL